MSVRDAGEGRYAQVEREQRWAVAELPSEARPASEILDRYISGTRLRLRRMEAGADVVFKLGQKVRKVADDPEIVKSTNIYLSADEYRSFAALPAAELLKTRWNLDWRGRVVAIDEFHGRHQGLLLAETELGVDEDRWPEPPFALSEVTNDDRFSGGALAAASDLAVNALIQQVRSLNYY
jgi:CYTH domain-containing protein